MKKGEVIKNKLNKGNKEKSKANSRILIVGFLAFLTFLMITILSVNMIPAQSVTYCCEKTTTGAYCQNMPFEQCDENFKTSPTACESTSYCKKGCCYDSDEGVCMENTPEEACRASNGQWSEEADCQTPQCNLGCCVIGTEAAYVTLARCKKLTGYYGLQIDFRTNIADELSCIVLATSQEQGACVFEHEFVKTCKFATRGECNSMQTQGETGGVETRFYKDYLCTAEQLETECGKSTKTMCKDGKVYWVDTCGNPANIYDSAKANDLNYWTKVVKPEDSCRGGARNCGNCDYLGSGTICKKESGARYGDYVCDDVNCYDTSDGKDHKNGESWCSYDTENNPYTDSAGSRHYRHICFMGEELVEPCADFRKQICVEDSIGERGDFSQAGCVVNRWHDCISFSTTPEDHDAGRMEDCLNSDQRDCIWIPLDLKDVRNMAGILEQGTQFAGGRLNRISSIENVKNNLFNIVGTESDFGRCVPKIAPGLAFWDQSAADHCSVGSQSCVVAYEKKLIGGKKKCVENCFCDPDSEQGKMTAALMALHCSSLGDCGPGSNYIGKFVNEGYEIKISKEGDEVPEQESTPAKPSANPDYSQPTFQGEQQQPFSQPAPATGSVIKDFVNKMFGRNR